LESAHEVAAEWLASPLGCRVLAEEGVLARRALENVFGFELLQLGVWGPATHLLDEARTQHSTVVAQVQGPGVALCAPLVSLPFKSDSVDGVVLPHTLELAEDPYAVLREAERVLCAEGCLMIYGFNPYSGWGARRLFARYFGQAAFPPQIRRMLSERRLRDWVALLGFDVDSVQGYLGYFPMGGVNAVSLDADAESWDRSLRPWIPATSGAYLIKARKRVTTLTLVRPKRRARQRVLVTAVEPTSKMGP